MSGADAQLGGIGPDRQPALRDFAAWPLFPKDEPPVHPLQAHLKHRLRAANPLISLLVGHLSRGRRHRLAAALGDVSEQGIPLPKQVSHGSRGAQR